MKQTPHAVLIYNPRAGQMNLSKMIDPVVHFWRLSGWKVRLSPTEAIGHATELAREAVERGDDLVIAAGGDGTLGDVANGLAGSDTIMAPLPIGTSNSFAKELRMPRPNLLERHKLVDSARSLLNGQVYEMDLGYTENPTGEGNGRYWLLWAGVGVDAYIVNATEPRPTWSKKLGPLGYFLQSLAVLPNDFPAMRARVQIDDQVLDDDYFLVLVSNCRLYAGGELLLSPEARLDDGLFEVWLFRGHGWDKVIQSLTTTWVGRHLNNPQIQMVNGRRITITTAPLMPCQTDGERAGQSPITCQIKPRALRILIPHTAPDVLFIQTGIPLSNAIKFRT